MNEENNVYCIDILFLRISTKSLNKSTQVLEELQPYTETWAGGDEGRIPLTPVIAYGFRLYQNNSQLNMHVDKKQTHIISMIYHIDSSDDSEPWPIFIEDLHGRTHEVVLTPGDILFYESAKVSKSELFGCPGQYSKARLKRFWSFLHFRVLTKILLCRISACMEDPRYSMEVGTLAFLSITNQVKGGVKLIIKCVHITLFHLDGMKRYPTIKRKPYPSKCMEQATKNQAAQTHGVQHKILSSGVVLVKMDSGLMPTRSSTPSTLYCTKRSSS